MKQIHLYFHLILLEQRAELIHVKCQTAYLKCAASTMMGGLRSVNALVGVTIIRIQTTIISQGADQTSAIKFKPYQDQEKNSKHLCTVIIIWDRFWMWILVDRNKGNSKTDQQS